jgi:hypothetical protein
MPGMPISSTTAAGLDAAREREADAEPALRAAVAALALDERVEYVYEQV